MSDSNYSSSDYPEYYSESSSSDREEQERTRAYRREAEQYSDTDDSTHFSTPYGSLSEDGWSDVPPLSDDHSIATNGEQPENLNDPITDTPQEQPRPRPVRRIEMFSDEEDMWEFDDGSIHRTPEGNTDEDSDDYSDIGEAQLTDQQQEIIDAIDFTNDLTKSKIVIATCAYTLEDDQWCVRCYHCNETYSAAGLLEHHSHELPTSHISCPTCHTPIESALLKQLLGKDEAYSLIERRWYAKLSTPIYTAYIDTLKLLHSAGVIYPQGEKMHLINMVRSLLSLINGHERPIPAECPRPLQLKTLALYNLTRQYIADFDSSPTITDKRIDRIPLPCRGSTLTESELRNLLYRPYSTAAATITFVIRMAKMADHTLKPKCALDWLHLRDMISAVSIIFDNWRRSRKSTINTPSEIIGMVYQQITELGTVTQSLSELISTRGYGIFKRHNTPLHLLLDAVIDALVPTATDVQRKIISEILNCGPSCNPFKGCPINFLQSLSKGEATCDCGGPIIDYTCLLCNQRYCSHCEEAISGFHQCSQDKLSTINELRSTTVKCPKCYVRIQKSEGCDHMFCTHCHGNFDWSTGKLIHESEQTNDMYVNGLSPIEQDYIYYIRKLVEDYEAHTPTDITQHKAALCHELCLIHTGLYDESIGAPAIILRPHLKHILKRRIAKESLSALRPTVANTIQNTLDVLDDTINDYEADAIADRIVSRAISVLREIF